MGSLNSEQNVTLERYEQITLNDVVNWSTLVLYLAPQWSYGTPVWDTCTVHAFVATHMHGGDNYLYV